MSSGLWNYKYGSLTIAANANQHEVVAAAADPSDSYNFAWNSDDPRKIASQSNLPPITSSRWNPDITRSTNTADVLNMTFYKELNVADTTTLLASGIKKDVGFMYWPDKKEDDYYFNSGDKIEWVAETSTPSGGNTNTNNNTNNDSAMMLAQGLAAGAALIAAFSF